MSLWSLHLFTEFTFINKVIKLQSLLEGNIFYEGKLSSKEGTLGVRAYRFKQGSI